MNTITTNSQQNFKGIERVLLGKSTLSLKNNLQKAYVNNVFSNITILSKTASCRESGFSEANQELSETLKETKLNFLKKYLVKLFVQKDAKKYIDSLFAKIKDVVFVNDKDNRNEVLIKAMAQIDVENSLKEIEDLTRKQGKENPTGKTLAKQKTLKYQMERLEEELRKLREEIRQNVINNTNLAIKCGVNEQDARMLTRYDLFVKE